MARTRSRRRRRSCYCWRLSFVLLRLRFWLYTTSACVSLLYERHESVSFTSDLRISIFVHALQCLIDIADRSTDTTVEGGSFATILDYKIAIGKTTTATFPKTSDVPLYP
jgi:hypothetical protein